MITGIGTDLIRIERIARAISSPAFLRRVFTERELTRAGVAPDRAVVLAQIFAGKEAAFKALAMEPDALRDWCAIEVSADGTEALLHGQAALAGARQALQRLHLTLSRDAEHAMAFAMAEGGGERCRSSTG